MARGTGTSDWLNAELGIHNERSFMRTVRALTNRGRLTIEDSATVEQLRTMAKVLDTDPGLFYLWAQYRMALRDFIGRIEQRDQEDREAARKREETDDIDAALASLFAESGD